jgi:transcriptional regulator with XRE-family HTH domain
VAAAKNRDAEKEKIIDKHVGMRLKLLRLSQKMSQTELGDAVGISFQQIQKYERGSNRIGASRMWYFCEIFETHPNYFFDGLNETVALPEDKESESAIGHMMNRQTHRLITLFDNIEDADARTAVLRMCEVLQDQ